MWEKLALYQKVRWRRKEQQTPSRDKDAHSVQKLTYSWTGLFMVTTTHIFWRLDWTFDQRLQPAGSSSSSSARLLPPAPSLPAAFKTDLLTTLEQPVVVLQTRFGRADPVGAVLPDKYTLFSMLYDKKHSASGQLNPVNVQSTKVNSGADLITYIMWDSLKPWCIMAHVWSGDLSLMINHQAKKVKNNNFINVIKSWLWWLTQISTPRAVASHFAWVREKVSPITFCSFFVTKI